MLTLLLLAASAAAAVPEMAEPVGDRARWVLPKDLPAIEGQVAVTTFDLIVDKTGEVSDCRIVVPSGDDSLDAAVCAALMKRARFKPAIDVDGTPLASIYRDRGRWWPKARGQNFWSKNPDLIVSTPLISKQVKKITEVVLLFDDTGVAADCVISESSDNAALDDVACAVAKNSQVSPPVTDRQGLPVRGLRSFYVGFQPGEATSVAIR